MDCIDRGEAMNLLNEAQVEYDENYKGLGLAKKIISDMKPTAPERPKGKWIDGICDKCGYDGGVEAILGKANYCLICGADMRGK